MKSYLNILAKILDHGYNLAPAERQGIGTRQINNHLFEHDLRNGFPLLTTKKMFWKGIVVELLWFLSGSANIKPLVDQGVNIWNEDAFKYAVRNGWRLVEYADGVIDSKKIIPDVKKESHMAMFLHGVKNGSIFSHSEPSLGYVGPGYGYQMRNFNGQGIDQIQNLVDNIKAAIASGNNNRRLIVNMWNPAQVNDVALPWCHKDFQVILEPTGKGPYFLNLTWNQRSCDTFLGIPYNIASYACLAHILAQQTGTIAKDLVGELRNVHLYDNHMDQAWEQIHRTTYPLPALDLTKAKDIFSYTLKDFKILHYQSHPALKADMVS